MNITLTSEADGSNFTYDPDVDSPHAESLNIISGGSNLYVTEDLTGAAGRRFYAIGTPNVLLFGGKIFSSNDFPSGFNIKAL
jgi:hypothetical protein